MTQRHPGAWAAARTIAMICQQLVQHLAAAGTAEEVACSIRAALGVFHISHHEHTFVVNQMPLPGSQVKSPSPANCSVLHQLQSLTTELEPHAAVLGWSEIRAIFLHDQFFTWSAALLSGAPRVVSALGAFFHAAFCSAL